MDISQELIKEIATNIGLIATGVIAAALTLRKLMRTDKAEGEVSDGYSKLLKMIQADLAECRESHKSCMEANAKLQAQINIVNTRVSELERLIRSYDPG